MLQRRTTKTYLEDDDEGEPRDEDVPEVLREGVRVRRTHRPRITVAWVPANIVLPTFNAFKDLKVVNVFKGFETFLNVLKCCGMLFNTFLHF